MQGFRGFEYDVGFQELEDDNEISLFLFKPVGEGLVECYRRPEKKIEGRRDVYMLVWEGQSAEGHALPRA